MSNVRDFGARGDGATDDSTAIEETIKKGDGLVHFPPGAYVLTRTMRVDLGNSHLFGLDGSLGTARILFRGRGPAFHLVGTHGGTADPQSVDPKVWRTQRLPTIANIEIEGRGDANSGTGFLLEGVMMPTFEGVLLRKLTNGIHLAKRNRNVLISHCHIYDLSGIGVYFDAVNLHQAIITGSHISYCKRGGIKILASEIRNLQITGNDIEYNFDANAEDSADVWIDSRDEKSSVREGTIVSNTIQAKYSRGGANIRMFGHNPQRNHKAGLFTISNNLVGSQEIGIHLHSCRGIVVTGNVIYSGHYRNLVVEGSRNIVIGPNCFDHNPDYDTKELCTGVRLVDSWDVAMNGVVIHDCQTGEHTVAGAPKLARDGLVEIVRCERFSMNGCEVLDGTPNGVYLEDCSQTSIVGCSILDSRSPRLMRSAVYYKGKGNDHLLSACRLDRGTQAAIGKDAGIETYEYGNLVRG